MRAHIALLAVVAVASVLCGSVPDAIAGAADIGVLASCEVAQPQGQAIDGTAGVVIHFGTSLAEATFRTNAGGTAVAVRGLVGVDTGVSPMQLVCDILTLPTLGTLDGMPLGEQLLAALGLTGREIKITKRSVFGCETPDAHEEQPCTPAPPRGLNLGVIPGSDVLSTLGDVTLFAVRP
jgi:hypothetical protein